MYYPPVPLSITHTHALTRAQPRGQACNGAPLAAAGSARLFVRESQGYAVHGVSGKGGLAGAQLREAKRVLALLALRRAARACIC